MCTEFYRVSLPLCQKTNGERRPAPTPLRTPRTRACLPCGCACRANTWPIRPDTRNPDRFRAAFTRVRRRVVLFPWAASRRCPCRFRRREEFEVVRPTGDDSVGPAGRHRPADADAGSVLAPQPFQAVGRSRSAGRHGAHLPARVSIDRRTGRVSSQPKNRE